MTFTGSTSELSTIIVGQYGPAFLGQPVSFLLSTRHAQPGNYDQSISGRVDFVPKKGAYALVEMDRTAFAVHLVDQVHDLASPYIEHGIQV